MGAHPPLFAAAVSVTTTITCDPSSLSGPHCILVFVFRSVSAQKASNTSSAQSSSCICGVRGWGHSQVLAGQEQEMLEAPKAVRSCKPAETAGNRKGQAVPLHAPSAQWHL